METSDRLPIRVELKTDSAAVLECLQRSMADEDDDEFLGFCDAGTGGVRTPTISVGGSIGAGGLHGLPTSTWAPTDPSHITTLTSAATSVVCDAHETRILLQNQNHEAVNDASPSRACGARCWSGMPTCCTGDALGTAARPVQVCLPTCTMDGRSAPPGGSDRPALPSSGATKASGESSLHEAALVRESNFEECADSRLHNGPDGTCTPLSRSVTSYMPSDLQQVTPTIQDLTPRVAAVTPSQQQPSFTVGEGYALTPLTGVTTPSCGANSEMASYPQSGYLNSSVGPQGFQQDYMLTSHQVSETSGHCHENMKRSLAYYHQQRAHHASPDHSEPIMTTFVSDAPPPNNTEHGQPHSRGEQAGQGPPGAQPHPQPSCSSQFTYYSLPGSNRKLSCSASAGECYAYTRDQRFLSADGRYSSQFGGFQRQTNWSYDPCQFCSHSQLSDDSLNVSLVAQNGITYSNDSAGNSATYTQLSCKSANMEQAKQPDNCSDTFSQSCQTFPAQQNYYDYNFCSLHGINGQPNQSYQRNDAKMHGELLNDSSFSSLSNSYEYEHRARCLVNGDNPPQRHAVDPLGYHDGSRHCQSDSLQPTYASAQHMYYVHNHLPVSYQTSHTQPVQSEQHVYQPNQHHDWSVSHKHPTTCLINAHHSADQHNGSCEVLAAQNDPQRRSNHISGCTNTQERAVAHGNAISCDHQPCNPANSADVAVAPLIGESLVLSANAALPGSGGRLTEETARETLDPLGSAGSSCFAAQMFHDALEYVAPQVAAAGVSDGLFNPVAALADPFIEANFDLTDASGDASQQIATNHGPTNGIYGNADIVDRLQVKPNETQAATAKADNSPPKSKSNEIQKPKKDSRNLLEVIKMYRCKACGFRSSDKSKALRHAIEQHSRVRLNRHARFACGTCRSHFATLDSCREHAAAKHPRRTTILLKDGRLYKQLIAPIDHAVTRDHRTSYSSGSIVRSDKDVNAAASTAAAYSNSTLSARLQLQKIAWKRKMDREQGRYVCQLKGCVMRFKLEENHRYHLRCHLAHPPSPLKRFVCPDCGVCSKRWAVMANHLWNSHRVDLELQACNRCDFKTYSLSKLEKVHKLIHSEEKRFECAECHSKFRTDHQLRNHRFTQHSSKARSDEYKRSKRVACPKCQRELLKKNLAAHIRQVHEGVSNEKTCQYCDMKTTSAPELRAHHSLMHKSERTLYCCEQCGFTTPDHNVHRKHALQHLAVRDRPYKCPFCEYACIQSTTYKTHLRKKHPDRAQEIIQRCPHCPFESISRSRLEEHTNNKHLS